MTKSDEQRDLEELVRRHGTPQSAQVEPLVSEIRSCLVAGLPRPVKSQPTGVLGGVVVMWEFSLPLGITAEFHAFLRQNEAYIADSLTTLTKGGGAYRGTYMQYGPGEPKYRTIWAYESVEGMAKAWADALADKTSRFYEAVRLLRAFWLRDPLRSEARWVPGVYYFDPAHDQGDAFAKLTLDAAGLNALS